MLLHLSYPGMRLMDIFAGRHLRFPLIGKQLGHECSWAHSMFPYDK
jgi:hypothetical protein